jgi:hypothetical protein
MQPQVPAIASASLLVAVRWSIDLLCAGAAPALVRVLQAGAAAVFMLAFAWWCPFKDARVLMHEVVNDLSPRTAAFVWSDIAATRKAAKAARSKSTQPTVV